MSQRYKWPKLLLGCTIDEVIDEAMVYAAKNNVDVEFDFNEVNVVVNKDTNPG